MPGGQHIQITAFPYYHGWFYYIPWQKVQLDFFDDVYLI